ncbi:MAG: ABC transporter permease, partial [Acidobacteria bacterium]|nr:ABC transporter permease [Acidobacteriota bacterium]
MSRLVQDFRHAVRACLRAPLVSALAVVAFALGIGVTTAVFSIFYNVLLKPLPFPDPEQLAIVYDTQPACATCPASFPKYHDWKARNQVFSAIGGSMQAGFVLSGRGEPVQVAALAATASLADVFRIRPMFGRWFSEEEDQPNGRKVIVLTHGFWTRQFARDPSIVGQPITLDGEPYDVIGVMPEHFSHRRADAIVPLALKLDPALRGNHFLVTYARMKPGVTVERAANEMRAIGVALAKELGGNHGVDVQAYREVVVGAVRPQLRMLLGAVIAVLLIGCANVANLLLAAGLARRRELGIRLALGARMGDLARQLIAEGTILATVGGAIGLLLTFWLLRTFIVLAGTQLPRAATIAIDSRVVLFAAAVTATVGVCCGLWPLVRMRTRELAASVREGDTRNGSGTGRQMGNGLVVGEVALAFALLVGGGLFLKNLLLLQSRDAGIQIEQVIA